MKRLLIMAATIAALCCLTSSAHASTLRQCTVPHLDRSDNGVHQIQTNVSCATADYFGTFSDAAGPGFRYAGQFWHATPSRQGGGFHVIFKGSQGGLIVVSY